MEKKFELTDETILVDEKTLHRIRALRDIEGTPVVKGDLGGFVEKEENLSHEGNCWIYNNARVFGNALVYDNAHVFGNAHIFGNARVYDNTCISGNAYIYGNARIYGDAYVYDNPHISGNARVYDNTCISGNAYIYGNAHIYGNAWVSGNVTISDKYALSNNAYVKSANDICYISSFGSKNRHTTFFRCKDDTIKVICGCFTGTLDEFRDKVKETHGDNKYAKEYLLAADLVEVKFSE